MVTGCALHIPGLWNFQPVVMLIEVETTEMNEACEPIQLLYFGSHGEECSRHGHAHMSLMSVHQSDAVPSAACSSVMMAQYPPLLVRTARLLRKAAVLWLTSCGRPTNHLQPVHVLLQATAGASAAVGHLTQDIAGCHLAAGGTNLSTISSKPPAAIACRGRSVWRHYKHIWATERLI